MVISQRVQDRRRLVATLAAQDNTAAEIAEILGVKPGLVSSDLNVLGISARRSTPKTIKAPGGTETMEQRNARYRALIAPLAAKGKSLKEIAEATGLTYSAVSGIARRLGIPVQPKTRHRGITPRVAERQGKVAKLLAEGKTRQEIMEELGIGVGTLSRDLAAIRGPVRTRRPRRR